MIILSQDTMLATEFGSIEIRELVNENQQIVGYSITVFTLSSTFDVAQYPTIEAAKIMFNDIMTAWGKETEFYDIHARELKLLK